MPGGGVFIDTEWKPLKSFSFLEFGSPVEQYLAMGQEFLDLAPVEGTSDFEREVRGRYYSHEANCYVEAAAGVVQQITTYECCLVQGVNIVGSRVSPILSLLQIEQLKWYFPHPLDPDVRIAIIASLGLEIVVSVFSEQIWRVTMRPPVPEYANREEQAVQLMGNVTDIRHARRSRRWGREYHPIPFRPFERF